MVFSSQSQSLNKIGLEKTLSENSYVKIIQQHMSKQGRKEMHRKKVN